MRAAAPALLLLGLATPSFGHMTMFAKSMFNFPSDIGTGEGPGGNPVGPVPPDSSFDDWWFRGAATRAAKPPADEVTLLPAGETITVEIACHVQWTSFGVRTTDPESNLDACPNGAGPYHADLPGLILRPELVSGCALAIADVEDIEDVTMDNLVVFSTQRQCVKQKLTDFEIPAAMPACSGKHCICAWLWLAESGQANYYQTGFQCKVTGAGANARAIALPPSDAVNCADDESACVRGPKRPLYAYNRPTNVFLPPNSGPADRPAYNTKWGFVDGAQNDIFGDVSVATTRVASNVTTSVSEDAAPVTTTTGRRRKHRRPVVITPAKRAVHVQAE